MDLDSGEGRIIRLLTEEQNRAILTIVDDAARPFGVDELAEALAGGGPSGSESTRRESELERLRLSLHHDHLPRLADAGLIEYDREANVVTRRDAAADAEWLDAGMLDELLGRFRVGDEPGENAIGVIEGRENVIERGRQLVDAADDELFLLYASDDLLEDDCIRHARDAIERGVDIYLGSQNPSVRDLTRKHLPEATIWEPQLDWMNVPSRRPTIARFVFADREELMLAVLDEPDSDGYQETAVTGEGETNPLVVLVRELLGPRLDHLDYQSEEFRSELPF